MKSIWYLSHLFTNYKSANILQVFHISSQHDSIVASDISDLARVESASMKTISILGLVFLPGTVVSVSVLVTSSTRCSVCMRMFVCSNVTQSLFGMNFFSFSRDDQGSLLWTTAPNFWWYWAVTIPVTLVTIFLWIGWQRISIKTRVS